MITSNRISYWDSIKGICILLVVAMHVNIPEPFPNAYDLMVPSFFLVSGYFISTKYGFRTFFKKSLPL